MGAQEEIWRDIEGYEGFYQISNLGAVYSVPRKSPNGSSQGGYLLKHRKYRNGYHFVSLYKDGHGKQFTIHRLVASAFIDNPRDCPEVNHIDGDKSNNAASNLEWCTRSENNKHAVKNGLRNLESMHEKAWAANLRPVVFYFEGSEVARFPSIRAAALVTGATANSIANCARGLAGTCDGYEVRYAEV